MKSWDVKILSYLLGKNWVEPEAVAKAVKGKYYADSWARPRCKRLVRMGYLERNEDGWYRIKADQIDYVNRELQQIGD